MFSMYSTKDHVSRGRVPGSQSHLLQNLRRGSMAAYFLRLWVQIPLGAWMSVCCECCVLSGRGLCNELIAPPEESYLCGVSECDLKTLTVRRPRPTRVVKPLKKKKKRGWIVKLISCICLVVKLRMSGAMSPFPHAFIVCKEINKDFNFLILDAGTPFFFFSGQEFWEQQKQKQLEEQRERREKEKLEALKKKDKHEHSAVASHEVKRKLMVSLYHVSIPE